MRNAYSVPAKFRNSAGPMKQKEQKEKVVMIECAFCGKQYPIEEAATRRRDFVNICEECFDDIQYGDNE